MATKYRFSIDDFERMFADVRHVELKGAIPPGSPGNDSTQLIGETLGGLTANAELYNLAPRMILSAKKPSAGGLVSS